MFFWVHEVKLKDWLYFNKQKKYLSLISLRHLHLATALIMFFCDDNKSGYI